MKVFKSGIIFFPSFIAIIHFLGFSHNFLLQISLGSFFFVFITDGLSVNLRLSRQLHFRMQIIWREAMLVRSFHKKFVFISVAYSIFITCTGYVRFTISLLYPEGDVGEPKKYTISDKTIPPLFYNSLNISSKYSTLKKPYILLAYTVS